MAGAMYVICCAGRRTRNSASEKSIETKSFTKVRFQKHCMYVCMCGMYIRDMYICGMYVCVVCVWYNLMWSINGECGPFVTATVSCSSFQLSIRKFYPVMMQIIPLVRLGFVYYIDLHLYFEFVWIVLSSY